MSLSFGEWLTLVLWIGGTSGVVLWWAKKRIPPFAAVLLSALFGWIGVSVASALIGTMLSPNRPTFLETLTEAAVTYVPAALVVLLIGIALAFSGRLSRHSDG